MRVSPIILTSLQNNFQEFLKGLPIGAFYRRTSKEIINEYLAETSKTDPQVTYNDFKICDEFDVMDKMSLIDVPCLIITTKFYFYLGLIFFIITSNFLILIFF